MTHDPYVILVAWLTFVIALVLTTAVAIFAIDMLLDWLRARMQERRYRKALDRALKSSKVPLTDIFPDGMTGKVIDSFDTRREP